MGRCCFSLSWPANHSRRTTTESAPAAKMDPANTEGIPLKCNLCPKEPLFSDVSHLLTHVFSKSHLSYKFKIELLAEKDAAARAKIAQYDTWCEKYGIQGLLAERIAAKEKRTAKRTRPSDRNVRSTARKTDPMNVGSG